MKNQNLYDCAYGYWRVTTEGDCEGRTTKDLGTYKGYIDEIALFLGNKVNYKLQFEALDPLPEPLKPTAVEVEISLAIDSKTWDMSPEKRAEWARHMFRGRPVVIKTGRTYASFVVVSKVAAELGEWIAKERALSKLTDEDKKALGLK